MFSRIIVLVVLCLGRYHDVRAKSNFSRIWSYDDEKTWPGSKCQNGGRRQSPIDIRTQDIEVDYRETFINNGPLKFTGYTSVLLTGLNNGLTVQLSTDGDPSIHPVLSGGPLVHQYRLEQMHFHWISEHAINGRKYPMEIHFVHVRTDLTVGQALKAKDGLAIVAIFCNVKAEISEEEEKQVSEMMELIPMLLKTGNRVSGALLNLKKLLYSGKDTYYAYAGSLTSPECNEAVIWIIFDLPLYLSDDHYRLFGKIGVSRQNFRSLQPLRHHVVYKPKPATVWQTPYIVSAVTSFVDQVKNFFGNMTRYPSKVFSVFRNGYISCKNFTETETAKDLGF